MEDEEKICQLALTEAPGIGDVTIKHLIGFCGSARKVFQINSQKLRSVPGIGNRALEGLKKPGLLQAAEHSYQKLQNSGISTFFFNDPAYPYRLKQVADAPSLIYFRGNCNLNHPRIIGLVGTRKATSYGRIVVENLMEELKKYNPLVVSGLAYGIDIAAHRAALINKIPTLAVFASGLDIVYPAIHKKSAADMLEQGGWLGEHKPGTQPEAHFFPARNRIIAGLCDAVIVVEAAEKGGALITADIANSYDREVFAVPGPINARYSQGSNNLIKRHQAHLLSSVKDLEYILNWDLDLVQGKSNKQESKIPEGLTDQEEKVVGILLSKGNELAIDDLSWQSQVPINQLAAVLLNLEFKGMVKALPGKRFRLKIE